MAQLTAYAHEAVREAAAFEVLLELAAHVARVASPLNSQMLEERGVVVLDGLIKEGGFGTMAQVTGAARCVGARSMCVALRHRCREAPSTARASRDQGGALVRKCLLSRTGAAIGASCLI
jgi:hypothetical protein